MKNEANQNISGIHKLGYEIDELTREKNKITGELLQKKTVFQKLKRQFDFVKTQEQADALQALANLFPEITAGRQLQIIALMLEFKSAQEIGDLCFISEKTVKYHKTMIYDKLNCFNEKGLFKLHSERIIRK